MSLFDHFRANEQPFAQRVLDICQTVAERYQPKRLNFLDPREQFIVQAIAGTVEGVSVSFSGGYDQAERRRAVIYTEYDEVSFEDFQLTLLSVSHHAAIQHRDLLGSLLGIGLKREMFGDILISETARQCIVASEVVGYVLTHLRKVGRHAVVCESVDWKALIPPGDQWKMKVCSVSSLRLDVILAELLSVSRTKATPLIKGGKVKVNWKVTEQPAEGLREGDILSVKGHGRFQLVEIVGKTRKDKFRVQLGRKEEQ
jgi:RNA-binding protein YlmH